MCSGYLELDKAVIWVGHALAGAHISDLPWESIKVPRAWKPVYLPVLTIGFDRSRGLVQLCMQRSSTQCCFCRGKYRFWGRQDMAF